MVVSFVLSALTFGVLANAVVENDTIPVDRRWHQFVVAHRDSALTSVFRAVTLLGNAVILDLVVAAFALVVARQGRRWEAALAAASLVSGQSIRSLIVNAIDRPRPPRSDWVSSATGPAFPSGHTATATIAWGLVATLLYPTLGSLPHRWAAIGIALIIILGVGVSRIYLGVHWPSDVLGGWSFGALWLTSSIALISYMRKRH